MKEDGRKNNGGNKNAGRKPVVDEKKKNYIIQKAVNAYYKTDSDEDGKIKLISDLLTFERGKMFIAEHLLGKPKEVEDSPDERITEIKVTRINGTKP